MGCQEHEGPSECVQGRSEGGEKEVLRDELDVVVGQVQGLLFFFRRFLGRFVEGVRYVSNLKCSRCSQS